MQEELEKTERASRPNPNIEKKSDNSDFGKLMAGMAYLSKKTQEYFGPEESEKLNPMELGLFFGAFNSACCLILKEDPSKSDMDRFTQHLAAMNVDNVLDKEKISNAPDVNVQDFITAISQLYSKRMNEYLDLIEIESKKPRGTSGYVDITCGVLNNLYEDQKSEDERYDPLFAILLANHISVLGKLIIEKSLLPIGIDT